MRNIIITITILTVSGCMTYRVVSPQEAMLMCNGEVDKLEAIVGKITCKGDK